MVKWPNPSERHLDEEIRRSFEKVQPPAESYSELIMNRIDQTAVKHGLLKRAMITLSAAAVIGICTIGAGFVSPAWADTLKQLPLLGGIFEHTEDPGLKLAAVQGMTTAPALSVTQDGVTLSITEAFYDGTRLALGFERSGINEERVLAAPDALENGGLDSAAKGLLGIPTVTLPSGEPVGFGSMSTGDVNGQPNTLLLELNALHNTASYGDDITVNVSVPVAQVKEPFIFQVPLKKVTEGIISLSPYQGASRDAFKYTVTKLELTPVSIRMVITSTGEVPVAPEQTGDYAPTEVFYELADDAGNIADPQHWGYSPAKAIRHPIVDNLYDAFPQVPKTITVRPYTCTFDENMNLLTDADGERKKTYYPELETTIIIP